MAYSKLSVTMRPYSDASFVLYGEDTKEIKDGIMNAGGRWNPNLKHPLDKNQKLKGYIFSNKHKEKLVEFLRSKDVCVAQVGGEIASSTAKVERQVDPNRPKNDRYTGERAMIRLYNEHYVIIYGYGKKFAEDIESDLIDLGFEKSNTLKHPLTGKGISGMKGKKIKKTSLIDFCIMQDIDYTELQPEEEDIYDA